MSRGPSEPDTAPDEEEGDEEELEGEWELDPNDPTHPDHDLSESAGYPGWEPAPKSILVRRGTVLLITLLVLAGLLISLVARLGF